LGSTTVDGRATALDALPWPQRIGLERPLVLREERYRPTRVRDGVTVSAPTFSAQVDKSGASLHLGERLAVASLGRAGAPVELVDAEPTISGAEVRRELAPGVSEWWRALPSGLEHGVTLERRPDGEGPLVIDVGVGGAEARAVSDDAVEFVRAKSGARIAPYAHLLVTDAAGARVPARMSVVDALVRIEVRDAGARYPLVVDPLVQEALLVPSDAEGEDNFGWSVALSADGTRALLGSSQDNTAAGSDRGSVRVFVRSGATWVEEATLLVGTRSAGPAA